MRQATLASATGAASPRRLARPPLAGAPPHGGTRPPRIGFDPGHVVIRTRGYPQGGNAPGWNLGDVGTLLLELPLYWNCPWNGLGDSGTVSANSSTPSRQVVVRNVENPTLHPSPSALLPGVEGSSEATVAYWLHHSGGMVVLG